jgi:Ca-activated chloride channel family protein
VLYRWLADPWALWLLTALPVLAGFTVFAWWRRRRARALLGFAHYVAPVGRWGRLVRGMFFTIGLVLLMAAIAGPQWGQRPVGTEELATGRDLVVVLDLSRSMLAEQPSRQEQALAALKDLANALQAHGGHRIALVVFANHARLVFPLTTDYDHFRDALEQQDADNLLPALRSRRGESARSGTRIGEALRAAVAAHDPKCKGAQDILLVSDGDDPAGDEEWAEGAEAARSQGIPVYALGVGDPRVRSSIPTKNGPLQHGGQVVMTKLEEKPLGEIARRTGGTYLAVRASQVPVGRWLRSALEARPGRRAGDATAVESLPLARPRFAWFFAAALACLTVSLLLSGGRFRTKGLQSDVHLSTSLWRARPPTPYQPEA